jgi:hypothetical protein
MLFYLLTQLLALTTAYVFPYGRCYDSKCSSSPYKVLWQPEQLNKTHGTYCFTFRTKKCKNTQYNCCKLFRETLPKIELHVNTQCQPALAQVTQNGKLKRGGVFFDIYTKTQSEIRLTALALPGPTVPNTTFCLTLKPPCIPLQNFLYSYKIAFWEVTKHECCPQCKAKRPTSVVVTNYCGDGICKLSKETCQNCQEDCGKCPRPPSPPSPNPPLPSP